jgi:Secretion system C-terminal sorting domain
MQGNLLYNFNANVGDEMEMLWSNPTNRHFTKVDSVKITLFLGQPKRTIYYSQHCNGNIIPRFATVVEGFGETSGGTWDRAINSTNCIGVAAEYYETFICYHDATRSFPQNCTVVSTEEKTQDKSQIAISPNPTSDILKINSIEPLQNLKIRDLLGKIVLEKSENNTETIISVENLPQGVYFLHINDVLIQKIIKN